MPQLEFVLGHAAEVTQKARLDAIWTTPMAAAELFGSRPPFALHEARVEQTPLRKVAEGYPKHIVVGVAVSPADPKTPEFSIRLVIQSLFKAVARFNETENENKIRRVGILPMDLGLDKSDVQAKFEIIHQAYKDEI